MKFYADRVPVALRQLLTDIFVVIWVYLWIRVALWIHDVVEQLAVPGQKLEGAGSGIADNLADAGGKVGRVPIVGDELTKPFNGAADAARSIAEAGRQQQEFVHQLALILPAIAVGVPLALVLFLWLPWRLGWIRRASVAATVRDDPAGQDLLALRALATQPLTRLAKLGPDIAQSWRAGDSDAVAALAELELKQLGLKRR
ncbi:hypothetical protein Ait01nite_028840 [Actinoplanes italicus]|uniref:Uncharacterized protein n=1 Tax=Actinoplanes italicus TaxID=113567 RepID=A0A2T0KIJ0_9ACTN|nr:hypothetical protein [Actinoplanes italicus]PRX23338.1 hypothetical protein CLV67_10383 [Actinoplanes italicus]GIE29839.1 hypothetical protein Ait01nite_028840 [Actinoplanes italicus]